MAPQQSVTLNNGVTMPLLGLGTFRLRGLDDLLQAVDAALECGYRSFDTAAGYHNEVELGDVFRQLLPKYGLRRSDIFITSKLHPSFLGPGTHDAFLNSMEKLDFRYLDLYLVHWPGKKGWRSDDVRNQWAREETWRNLEFLYSSGNIRALGVSNYTEDHLAELLELCRIRPAVLQVECHPRLPQTDLIGWCKQNGIHLQAYSSLGCGDLLGDAEVCKVANVHGRTPSQVLLRWALQQGVGVIPKASAPARIKENFNVWDFELSNEEIEQLKGGGSKRRYCWDPTGVA
ncbi:9,11-endoperoxide prostaglandin H2 reductase-like isoform X2 [Dendrobates tinctorius]|uniref:9,11-endoperoxide prostaglandin H2 reductase-like isoform X2 n=1 Tax=Dendrobates tinctorius TaxID=92724 RepID=UPI003CC95E23